MHTSNAWPSNSWPLTFGSHFVLSNSKLSPGWLFSYFQIFTKHLLYTKQYVRLWDYYKEATRTGSSDALHSSCRKEARINKIGITTNCGKYYTKHRERVWYWSPLIQPTLDESVSRKSWWQECKVTGPMVCTTRRQTQESWRSASCLTSIQSGSQLTE